MRGAATLRSAGRVAVLIAMGIGAMAALFAVPEEGESMTAWLALLVGSKVTAFALFWAVAWLLERWQADPWLAELSRRADSDTEI